MIKFSPSILACDYMNMGKDIDRMEQAGADWLHLDIMDGLFVPNISFGPAIVSAVDMQSNLPLDVHLMIVDPDRYIDAFAKAGADYLTVHAEAVQDLSQTLDRIHAAGMKAGVSLKPATDPAVLEGCLSKIDLVLVMTVEPGFGGQKLIPETLEKVKTVAQMLNGVNGDALIEVDGGITMDNAMQAVQALSLIHISRTTHSITSFL